MRQFLEALHDSKLIHFDSAKARSVTTPSRRENARSRRTSPSFSQRSSRSCRARRATCCASRPRSATASSCACSRASRTVRPRRRPRTSRPRSRRDSSRRCPASRPDPDALDAPLSTAASRSCTTACSRPRTRRCPEQDKPRCISRSAARCWRVRAAAARDAAVRHRQSSEPWQRADRRPSRALELAELNVRAGVKARDATAYELAVRCFKNAVDAARRRKVGRALRRAMRRASAARGEPRARRRLPRRVRRARRGARARALADRSHQLYTIKTSVLLIMGRIPAALACGRDARAVLGVDLPEETEQVRARFRRDPDDPSARPPRSVSSSCSTCR